MSGFAKQHDSGKVPCRKCGFPIAPEASVCGNCGTPARGRLGGGPATATQLSGGFIRTLVFLAALGLATFLIRAPLADAFDSISRAFETQDDSGRRSGNGSDDGAEAGPGRPGFEADGRPEQAPGFSGVRDVAKALNRGGLGCRGVRVDAEDEYVSSGSCQVRGIHVQINVYLARITLDSVRDSFFDGDYPFAFVVVDNAYVITQGPVARRVHRILGGRLRLPG